MPQGLLLSDQTAEEATRPLVIVSIFFIVLTTLIVALKTFSRQRLAKLPFWWDDFWIFPAWILAVAQASMAIAMCQVEVKYDNEDRMVTNLAELAILLKLDFAVLELLLPAFASTRFSILCLYLRIFSDRNVRRAIWATCGFVLIQWVAFGLTGFAICQPLAFYWDKTLKGTCVAIDPFFRSITLPNIVVDVIILILPLHSIWRLRASRLRKWALTLLFGLGSLALAASIARFYVFETHTATEIAPQKTNVLVMWLVVEPAVYVIAVCLPGMHHLFAAMIPRILDDWVADRMAALKHPLSLSGSRGGGMVGGSGADASGNGTGTGGAGSSKTRASTWRPGAVMDEDTAKLMKMARFGGEANFRRLEDDSEMGYDMTVQIDSLGRQNDRKGGGRGRGRGNSSAEVFELDQTGQGQRPGPGGGLKGGIVVTKEVIVTQEERIARVIGL